MCNQFSLENRALLHKILPYPSMANLTTRILLRSQNFQNTTLPISAQRDIRCIPSRNIDIRHIPTREYLNDNYSTRQTFRITTLNSSSNWLFGQARAASWSILDCILKMGRGIHKAKQNGCLIFSKIDYSACCWSMELKLFQTKISALFFTILSSKSGLFFGCFSGNRRSLSFRNIEFWTKFLEFLEKILEFQQKAWVFDQLLRYCWGIALMIALVQFDYLFEFGKNLTSGSWWISDFPKNWVLKYCLEFLRKNAWVLVKIWLEFWYFGAWVLKK